MKTGLAPAGVVELVELRQHLERLLGARTAAVDFDDVAELAVEGAAARALHGHGAVAAHADQAQIGQRSALQSWPLCALVERTCGSALQIGGKRVDQIFGLADHHVVALELRLRHAAGNRSTNHRAQAARAAAAHDADQLALLDLHTADQGHVSPGEIAIPQPLDVGVDEALVPRMRQQRRYRHQPQRRLRGAFALKREGVAKTPVGIGEARINQQHVHDCISTGKGHRRIVLPLCSSCTAPVPRPTSVCSSAPQAQPRIQKNYIATNTKVTRAKNSLQMAEARLEFRRQLWARASSPPSRASRRTDR